MYVSEISFFWKIFKQVLLNDSKNHYGIHQGTRMMIQPMFITAWFLPEVGCLPLTLFSRIHSFGLWGTSVTGPGKAFRGLNTWFRHLSSLLEWEWDLWSPPPSTLPFSMEKAREKLQPALHICQSMLWDTPASKSGGIQRALQHTCP